MKDLRRKNLRQLFLDFIDLGEDEDAWKNNLEIYDDLLAEVKGLRAVIAQIHAEVHTITTDVYIYEDSYCTSCDDVWNWDAHAGKCPTCNEEMKVIIE